jgi:hypothetical protein
MGRELDVFGKNLVERESRDRQQQHRLPSLISGRIWVADKMSSNIHICYCPLYTCARGSDNACALPQTPPHQGDNFLVQEVFAF